MINFKKWLQMNQHNYYNPDRFYEEMDIQVDWLTVILDTNPEDLTNTWFDCVTSFRDATYSEYLKAREAWKQKSWR